ncbi:IPT/TIG domain-containing protein [Mucilaginibacter sp.]
MKKIILKSKNLTWILSALMVFGLASCRKNNSLGFTAGTGVPTITSVHTLSKSDTSKVANVITTIDNNGNVTQTTGNFPINPMGFDSVTNTGNLQQYYVIYGANLGSTTHIYFNGANAYFNRALVSDQSLIVSIPITTPTSGTAATNKLLVTTLYGSVTYKFIVLPPPPTILQYSTNDFIGGSTITLTGQGFGSVTSVNLKTTGDATTIVSQSDTVLVLKFPTSAVTESPLLLNYSSNGKTLVVTSTIIFNDLDNAYVVFTDNYGAGWSSNSWGVGAPSTAQAKTGTTSWATTYPKGNYWANGFGINTAGLPSTGYTYLSFWIKGGIETYSLYLTADTRGGFGNSDKSYPITVPAGVWTYFKLPLSTLNLSGSQHFGFWIAGPADQNETFYFDDVVLLK